MLLLVTVAWLARMYLLQVYAPGLRTEARAVPALVHTQLAAHGARYVPRNQMSPYLKQAIVAIEDWRFYHHPGIDPLGLIRAAWINVRHEHIDQGGSTLEQQLVKRAIVHDDSSWHQKLRTMAIAWAVDQEMSKPAILEEYLNAAYYGQGAYGAGAAARTYFGTDAAHLSLAEAAFLAALPQAPSIYGDHPLSQTVIDRKDTVLNDMAKYGYITRQEATAARAERLNFALPNP